MSARTATTARLSRLAARLGGRTDRELLREFVADRCPAAFAELVRRHGPLVFGVCRRTLRHQQDSEDAFQATFLVLARRAARITTPEKLPGWLHSVAVRTATEIRRMRDRHIPANPEPQRGGSSDTAEQHELAAAVDEVLAALPDHYRLPVVLCELRGLSRKQAAAELRIAEGTLSSRLAKARKLLAERLTKRGFAASVAAVSAALAGSATAKVPDTVAALAVGSWGGTISTSVSVASDTVVKAMFASKLNGLVVSGGLMLAVAGGLMIVPGGAGAQPGDTPTAKAKTDPAEALVQQFGSKEFTEREAAEKKLREMGAKALPAVRAGVKSTSPEVAERCERVLAHIRTEVVRKQFAKLVGDDKPARELFDLIRGSERGWQAIVTASEAPAAVSDVYRTRTAELVRVSRGLPPVDENGEPTNPSSPSIHGPPPVPFADVAAWLYLGTLTPGTEKWSFVTHKAWHNQTSSHFEFLPEDDYTSAKQMAKEYTTGALAVPLKALTVKWLEKRRENDGLRAGLTLALRYDIPEVLPAVRALLTKLDPDVQPPNVAAAVAAVAEFGTKGDVELLLPHLTDARVHTSIVTELPKGITGREGFSIADMPGVKKRVCQVRDIAGAAVLKLARRETPTSGFQPWPQRKHENGSPKSLTMITGIGFETDDARYRAFDRHQILFVLAPVPRARAKMLMKLSRVPDASPELQKALSQLDKDYRHGTPAQFAELEKKADEMLTQFAELHTSARIWFEVAHVAAQSGIDKQAERVRKYAEKSLDVNRDPLQRATLYSYLASAEEVSSGAFADRRRIAAGCLLAGYVELLAQELPDEKPELPNAPSLLGRRPENRARNEALAAAIVEARFIQEQIDRRDVLVKQLRDLYKPDAKRAGRDEKGPDELRALAANMLADDAAVKMLMEWVLK